MILSQATEEELTPEYKEERDALIKELQQGIVPKEKNGLYVCIQY